MSELSLNFELAGGESLRLLATPSPTNPDQCTFVCNRPLYPRNSAYFGERSQAQGSPLVENLFAVEGIADVLVNHDTLRLTLFGDANWEDKFPLIGMAVRDAIETGGPLISDSVTESQLEPEELRRRVQQVLDGIINPAVASHGGVVNLLDITNNTVYLQFGGGCQGCGMVSVTLKYGVERTIRDEVPEVGEIMDTTDHAAGRNPYYAPSSK